MSVVVKRMEMPTDCSNCIFKAVIGPDRWRCKASGEEFYAWDVGWGDKPYIRHSCCPLENLPSAQPDVPDTNVGDLISREAMGDALNRMRVSIDETWYSFYQKALNELCNLPSAQQWIPTTEARPPRQTKVIVTDWGNVTLAYINDDGNGTWMDYHGNKLKDVTAWMYLPEPYKESD